MRRFLDSKGTLLLVMTPYAVVLPALPARVYVWLYRVPSVRISSLRYLPDKLEATAEARKFTLPYPPSSPSIALFKDGKLVHFIERHHIEAVQQK